MTPAQTLELLERATYVAPDHEAPALREAYHWLHCSLLDWADAVERVAKALESLDEALVAPEDIIANGEPVDTWALILSTRDALKAAVDQLPYMEWDHGVLPADYVVGD